MALPRPQVEHESGLREFATEIVSGVARTLSPELIDTKTVATVVEALSRVERHSFVEPAFAARAYDDVSLPIGFGQTISKPSTVCSMLLAAMLSPGDRVLEIGAGSGYLTALLAQLGVTVFAMERIPLLARTARQRLDQLGYSNIMLRSGNGARGWRDMAPFQAVLVSTTFESIPEPLLVQLAEGGRLVAPMLVRGAMQKLVRFEKLPVEREGELRFRTVELGSCHFVMALD